VIAYIPVLHDGYRRFIQAHAQGRRLFLIGPELYADYRPLAKDIRCIDAALLARAIASWDVCAEVSVLDESGARSLAGEAPAITLPAEDVSYQVVERFFGRCEVQYDTVFLRWDKTRTAQLLRPRSTESSPADPALAELAAAATAQADASVDWWRQVGAALRLGNGAVLVAGNEHQPHRLSAYVAGDPRANFFKGIRLELSTAMHAEARLIAQAAREGLSTVDGTMFVTDFPCPPCAKLIAAAGIEKLFFREGYAVLDGVEVLAAAGITVARVSEEACIEASLPA
jgi:dCMP deaminase